MTSPRAENPGLAAALILLSTVFIAGSMTMAKALATGAMGAELHPLQVSHGRFLARRPTIHRVFQAGQVCRRRVWHPNYSGGDLFDAQRRMG